MCPSKFADEEVIYELWERCWRDNKNHNITFIGKLMTKAKQRGLREIIRDIKLSNVIDVGCGLGFSLETFAYLGLDAIGIDVSKTAIDICKSKGLKVFHKKLEDVSENYDLVFSDGLLEHFLNFQPYVEHLMRISNRYLLIIQTDHESFWGKTSIYLAQLIKGSRNIWEYNYRIKDFISLFHNCGFKLVREKAIFAGIFKLLLFQKN